MFLLDVDNTVLDNDHVIAHMKAYLTCTFGAERRQRYWTIFEQWRERGDAEYLGRAQVEELEAAPRLVKESFGVTDADGTGRADFDLLPHAIAAVTLELTSEPSVGGAAK